MTVTQALISFALVAGLVTRPARKHAHGVGGATVTPTPGSEGSSGPRRWARPRGRAAASSMRLPSQTR